MQTLQIDGKKIEGIEAIFDDAGKPPEYQLINGIQTLTNPGKPPAPRIIYRGGGFYYGNGVTPVRTEADVEHLGEPHRAEALAWIRGRSGQSAVQRMAAGKAAKKRRTQESEVQGRKIAFDPAEALGAEVLGVRI